MSRPRRGSCDAARKGLESNWTTGVDRYDLIGVGAGLAARVIDPDLGYVVTNKREGPLSPRALLLMPIIGDLMELVYFDCNAHLQPFPFGFVVEAP